MFKKVECVTCNGWGWLNSDIRQTCPSCNGLGQVSKINYLKDKKVIS